MEIQSRATRRRMGCRHWALAALLAPPGPGLALPALALAAGATPVQALGLLLLAATPCVWVTRTSAAEAQSAGRTPDEAGAPAPAAVELRGRWRRPPGGEPRLVTDRGGVPLRLSADLPEPAPGTPVRAWARVSAAAATAQVVSWRATGPPRGAWLDRWALHAEARLERLAPPARRGCAAALLLGDRRELPPAVRRQSIVTGTAHLFALSGLHVVLVAGLLGRLAVLALGHRPPARWAQGWLLAAFCALAGQRAPLLRATLGWGLLAWAGLSGRPSGGLSRLGSVALLLLVFRPGLQHELSAQLSFAAVAGLLGLTRGLRGPLAWWLAPTGAFLATAPLAAEVFGHVQPWGIVVTPLLLPWVAALLALGLPCVLAGSACAALDPLTGPLLSALCGGLQRTLEELALRLPAPWHPPPAEAPGWLLSAGVVLALHVVGGGLRSGRRATDTATWSAPTGRLP